MLILQLITVSINIHNDDIILTVFYNYVAEFNQSEDCVVDKSTDCVVDGSMVEGITIHFKSCLSL